MQQIGGVQDRNARERLLVESLEGLSLLEVLGEDVLLHDLGRRTGKGGESLEGVVGH